MKLFTISDYDNLYRIVKQLWNEDTQLSDLASHLCFMVVSSFAFFFFVVLISASVMESNGIILSDADVNTVNILIGWSNVFLNVLFFLIVVETSQMIANAYWKWRRDNL
jgi:hypothetical protein